MSRVSSPKSPVYLLWLEWAEKCFRLNARDLAYFRSLVPANAKVVRARSERAFLKALPGATHAVVWDFKSEWFANAPNLRVLATPAAGRELVPTEGPKGVRIHFGGFHGQIIAESVIAFMLAWSRGFFVVRKAPTGWPRVWLSDKCRTLAGTTAVIAGYGRIGRAIGAKLAPLGVDVYGITRHGFYHGDRRIGQSADRPVLSSADWFVLALPSTTGSDDFLDAKLIAKLPRSCVVVNVGRGNAVDERALADALAKGRLAGAYLDVCKAEPTAVRRKRTPTTAIDPKRPNVPNLVLMPHASAFSPDYIRLCFKELKDDGCI